MKFKIIAALSITFALYFLISSPSDSFGSQIQLKDLGKSPFYSVKDLKAEAIFPILKKYEKDVQNGFIKAGSGILYKPFMKALETATLEEIKVQPGETFTWMIFKKKNKPFVLKNVKWAGKSSFKAFRMVLQHEGKDYEFVFPNICLNFALKKVSPTPVAAVPVPAPVVTQAPAPKTGPKADGPGVPATDPSKKAAPTATPPGGVSTPAPGSVPAPPAGITGAPSAAPSPAPAGVGTPAKPAVAPPPIAAPAPAPPVKAAVLPKPWMIVGDVGYMKQLDPATFMPIRVGYMHKFSEKTSLMGLIGFAPLLEGCEDNPPKLLDVLYSYDFTPSLFIGAGIGMWHTSFDTRIDFILETGAHLTKNPTGVNFDLFVEGRSAFDEFDEISDLGRFGAGIRILF
jgi:hypothetical protein